MRLDLAADHGHLRLGLEADVAVDDAASEPVTVAVDEDGEVEGTVQPFRRFLGFEASLQAANAALAGLTYVSGEGHT